MFNIGPWELMLILLVALIVVGPGKLPEVARSIGKGINEFKNVTNGYKKEFQEAFNEMDQKSANATKPVVVSGSTVDEVADQFNNIVVADQTEPAVNQENSDAPKE